MHPQICLGSLVLTALLAAQQPPPVTPPAPPAGGPSKVDVDAGRKWFPELQQTLAPATGATEVVGTFRFANPHGETVEWREFEASCSCSHLEFVVGDRRYWMKPKPRELVQLVAGADGGPDQRLPVAAIPVHAAEAGEVQVHVQVSGLAGKKGVHVDIHSTDATAPMVRLGVEVRSSEPLVVTPREIDLGHLTPAQQRDFEVEVRAPAQRDFEVKPALPLPPGFRVECARELRGGIMAWRIRGSYGPVASGTGGTLKFTASVHGAPSFTVRVVARVAPAVEVTPGFVSLGQIKQGAGALAEIRIHANDGTDLEAIRVALERPSAAAADVTGKARKDGKDLLIEITVPRDAPGGLVRGDIVVALNHPEVRELRVLFNGFVR